MTYDEKKAAEAAFTGRSFNPAWSEAAKKIYDGIVAVMATTEPTPAPHNLEPAEPVA